MQVVEISTDEEDEEDEERRSPSPKKGRKGKGKETEKEREKEKEKEEISGLGKEKEKDHKVAASKSKVGFDQPPEEKQEEDVRMAEANVNEDSKRPTTPPPHSSIPLNPKTPLSKNENTVNTDTSALMTPGFQFMPALSKEPFVNLTSLTEEEAAMTVEEWIKYQMGIEYERFKKDGERELAAFERKADEVRRTIEAL
ncbi:hypothetical protein K435DRAFT_679247 [Dendrothele bispora CBS 962.96]|uniref:Uncharacterized protein n=1 Tax=Dendrothele bispora (strain CBS 962.96) TaxID=1314807 RepID=A0A4S8LI43_DENBC|nr:hypothetical protein K435DRAFT_679247 [Dendrothele bispora CBS 962.96]